VEVRLDAVGFRSSVLPAPEKRCVRLLLKRTTNCMAVLEQADKLTVYLSYLHLPEPPPSAD
jgi:hypothetical protein